MADELFGLAPANFIRARDARARAAREAGDRELATRITALRKPTNVAWLANQLARDRPEQVRPFLTLGESLREATASLRGPALRELSRQRQQLVHALVQQGRALATDDGPRVTEDVARGLEETLHAALSDPSGAGLLAAGRLSSGLRYSGFGDTPSAPLLTPPAEQAASATTGAGDQGAERRTTERQQVEESLAQAWSRARRAAESRDAASARVDEANQAYDDAAARVRMLEKELQELQRALEEARRARDGVARDRADARVAHDRASRAADEARRVVTDLQSRLDAL